MANKITPKMTCCKTWRESLYNVHPECLRNFLKKKKIPTAMEIAIKLGKFDCLYVFLEFNYHFPYIATKKFIEADRIDMLELAYANGVEMEINDCREACKKNTLLCLQYLHNKGCPWDEIVLETAIRLRKFEHIKYLCENGCPITENVLCTAVKSARIEYVEYLLNYGGLDKSRLTKSLYCTYHLKIIKYLHEHDCPWDEDTFAYYASYGKINILKYLHKNGCPWNEKTCYNAAHNRDVGCLKYVHENGCPIGDENEYTYIGEAIRKYIDMMFEKNEHKKV
jgi:hypothetical protein